MSSFRVITLKYATSCRTVPKDHQDVSSLTRRASCIPYLNCYSPAFASSRFLCPTVYGRTLPLAYPCGRRTGVATFRVLATAGGGCRLYAGGTRNSAW